MEYLITQRYSNHYGVDLKNNDLTRKTEFASEVANAQYRESGSPEKRKGYQAATAGGGIGAFFYQRANPLTGLDESEKLVADENLQRVKASTLSVVYSGAEANCRISVFYDPATSQYRCQITEGIVLVLDQGLGIGFDEVSTFTLTQLDTAISALSNFSANVSGDGSVPAAFLQIVRDWDLVASNFMGMAEYLEQVYSPVANPFSASWAKRFNSEFELISSVNIQNNIYFGHADLAIMKYDGNSVYRAGIPAVASISATAGAAGSVTGTNYYHQAQYIQKDAAGQFIEGNILTADSQVASVTAQSMDVTVANIQAGTGYNTNCAIVVGAQVAATTLSVDNGAGGAHTIHVGDTAYFYDAVSAAYVEREVTARTSSTITIAGAGVTVADNAVISNNLRIGIYRNLSSGTFPSVWYLVAEIPNNSFSATQVFVDDVPDSGLGAEITPPFDDRSPPKKGAYVSQWNNVMMTAGDPENPTLLFYSSGEGPEYFPVASNEIIYGTAAGDPIKGIAANNEVFAIMGRNSFGVLTGDIIQNALRLEVKSEDIGCACHATIREMNGALAWLSPKGPRTSAGGQVPRPLGEAVNPDGSPSGASRIDPEFNSDGKPAEVAFLMSRAVGVHDRKTDKYLLFVPAVSIVSGVVRANENSRVYSYDYNRDAWLVWTNINMMAGAIVDPIIEDLYWVETAFSNFASSERHVIYRRHKLNDAWDYADNNLPIGGTLENAWEYSTQWEPLGQPSLLKKFLKLRVFALEEIANNRFSLNVVQELNYQRENTRTTFSLQLSGAGYGNSSYGIDPYGDPARADITHTLHRDRTTATRIRFRNNTIHENVIISGWELEAVTPYRVAMKQ